MSYRAEIMRILNEEGLRGLTRGYHALLFRDAPGFACYFAAFDAFKRLSGVQKAKEENRNDSYVKMKTFFCGGCAGIVGWCVAYPFDMLKSRI